MNRKEARQQAGKEIIKDEDRKWVIYDNGKEVFSTRSYARGVQKHAELWQARVEELITKDDEWTAPNGTRYALPLEIHTDDSDDSRNLYMVYDADGSLVEPEDMVAFIHQQQEAEE